MSCSCAAGPVGAASFPFPALRPPLSLLPPVGRVAGSVISAVAAVLPSAVFPFARSTDPVSVGASAFPPPWPWPERADPSPWPSDLSRRGNSHGGSEGGRADSGRQKEPGERDRSRDRSRAGAGEGRAADRIGMGWIRFGWRRREAKGEGEGGGETRRGKVSAAAVAHRRHRQPPPLRQLEQPPCESTAAAAVGGARRSNRFGLLRPPLRCAALAGRPRGTAAGCSLFAALSADL